MLLLPSSSKSKAFGRSVLLEVDELMMVESSRGPKAMVQFSNPITDGNIFAVEVKLDKMETINTHHHNHSHNHSHEHDRNGSSLRAAFVLNLFSRC
jgi:hypothetical protein